MPDKHKDIEHWSWIVTEWMAWARAPNHDAFWAYRASLLAFIGQGAGDALDVGCGEGRVSRVLKECGYRVTAIDPLLLRAIGLDGKIIPRTTMTMADWMIDLELCAASVIIIAGILEALIIIFL